MERDLLLFIRHTDEHVVEELKKKNPEWITPDGFCPRCLAHYKAALQGQQVVVNIAGSQVTQRQFMAAASLFAAALFYFALVRVNLSRGFRLLLFPPLFAMFLGYFQAKNRHCVVLGLKGARNMDDGEKTVAGEADKRRLRKTSVRLLALSFLLAALLTTVGYFLP